MLSHFYSADSHEVPSTPLLNVPFASESPPCVVPIATEESPACVVPVKNSNEYVCHAKATTPVLGERKDTTKELKISTGQCRKGSKAVALDSKLSLNKQDEQKVPQMSASFEKVNLPLSEENHKQAHKCMKTKEKTFGSRKHQNNDFSYKKDICTVIRYKDFSCASQAKSNEINHKLKTKVTEVVHEAFGENESIAKSSNSILNDTEIQQLKDIFCNEFCTENDCSETCKIQQEAISQLRNPRAALQLQRLENLLECSVSNYDSKQTNFNTFFFSPVQNPSK